MNTIHTEVLSALVDGEPVDLAKLAAALDDADARRALIDFVKLRQALRSDVDPLPASLDQPRQRRTAPRLVRWAAAAAVLLLVFLAGMFTPIAWDDTGRNGVQPPPQPVRVETFQPGVDWHPGD